MVRRRRARLFQPHVYLRPRSTVVPDQLDGKRPTLSCDLRHVVRSQSAVWRLFAQVDFRREMRPIAFVDPGAFMGANPRNAAQLIVNECIGQEATVELATSQFLKDSGLP